MVTLIGMGSGSWEALSVQAQDAVRGAGLVFGAKRLLAGLPPECTARQFALYQPADILETLAQAPGQDAAVLYSGDTGFYSGASGLLTPRQVGDGPALTGERRTPGRPRGRPVFTGGLGITRAPGARTGDLEVQP